MMQEPACICSTSATLKRADSLRGDSPPAVETATWVVARIVEHVRPWDARRGDGDPNDPGDRSSARVLRPESRFQLVTVVKIGASLGDHIEADLRETIASYDRNAAAYEQRYASIDLSRYRDDFTRRIPRRTGPVLDAGCGPGRDAAHFAALGMNVVGVDLSRVFLSMLARLDGPVPVHADLRQLPFANRSFAGVWMCASLVHLCPEQASRALAEAQRVLVTNGVLFCTVPAGSGTEWRPDEHGGRRRFVYYDRAKCRAPCERGWLYRLLLPG